MGEIKLGPSISYEKIVIWAEESVGISTNATEWSYGNGATGIIGIPLVEDWEIYGFSFHANTAGAGASVSISIMDFINASYTILTTVNTVNQGQTNNYSFAATIAPVAAPQGTVLGFRTATVSGSISNARCAVWLRRVSS